MKKVKSIIGVLLFIAGLVCSSAQKEDGSPAPLFTMGSALVMVIGGKMLSDEINREG